MHLAITDCMAVSEGAAPLRMYGWGRDLGITANTCLGLRVQQRPGPMVQHTPLCHNGPPGRAAASVLSPLLSPPGHLCRRPRIDSVKPSAARALKTHDSEVHYYDKAHNLSIALTTGLCAPMLPCVRSSPRRAPSHHIFQPQRGCPWIRGAPPAKPSGLAHFPAAGLTFAATPYPDP